METDRSTIKKEVSCKALIPFFIAAKDKKIDLYKLLAGVPYELPYLQNKHERIDWNSFCQIVSNSKTWFTPLEYEKMGRDFIRNGSFVEGFFTAFFMFSSNRLSRICMKQFSRIIKKEFTCLKHNIEFPEANRIRATAYIDDDCEFCPEFFLISKGIWEQFGKQIGHKEFKLEIIWIDRGAIFDVFWRKEDAFFKLKRWTKWLFNFRKAVADLTDSHEELFNQYNKLEESKELLEKKTTILKTTYEITRSIRQSFNINSTLSAIVSSLVKEVRLCSAKIILFKDIEGNDLSIEVRSEREQNYLQPIKRNIIINELKIGELIVYPEIYIDPSEADELFNYLMPIINISIHDALVLRTISDYRNNLELKINERTAELNKASDELSKTIKLLQESQQVQNRFFTNISHEFRTPLTLILSPAKQLSERSEDYKVREELNTIYKNASRLLRLVNQLLDISKLESGNMKLHAAPSDIVSLIKTVMISFCSYAERKKINLKFDSPEESIIAFIDKDKIEKIFLNILSNAFKFTPERGSIEVIVNRYSCMSSTHINCTPGITEFKECVRISVADSGIGIPKDKLSKIFDRFYQVDYTNKREHEGTGIGLALTKELVELHRGRIEVESLDGSGTTFTVYIPLGRNHLTAEEIFEDTKADDPDFVPGENYAEEAYLVSQSHYPFPENGKPILLLVEDNCDVRNYLKSNLQDEFTIFEAANGLDGWKISEIHLPDLIVSDVMMPGLDGFELCTKIKNDERTSHIPVILLTAKAAAQDKIEGLNLGADEYIMKPFEPDELRARIRNLIEQRKRIHEHFRKHGLFEIDEKSVTKFDRCFLQKVMNKINEHVSDHSLNVELLIKELAISRSVLQRKILSLTGETPGELIRRVRLKKAAVLIEQNFGNISEIALEVGFNNPAHFSEAFKKQFGHSPFHYHQKFLRNNSVKK